MTADEIAKGFELAESINNNFYWIVAFQVINMCLLVTALFFIALKAGKS